MYVSVLRLDVGLHRGEEQGHAQAPKWEHNCSQSHKDRLRSGSERHCANSGELGQCVDERGKKFGADMCDIGFGWVKEEKGGRAGGKRGVWGKWRLDGLPGANGNRAQRPRYIRVILYCFRSRGWVVSVCSVEKPGI